jgi:hypothetical protein
MHLLCGLMLAGISGVVGFPHRQSVREPHEGLPKSCGRLSLFADAEGFPSYHAQPPVQDQREHEQDSVV